MKKQKKENQKKDSPTSSKRRGGLPKPDYFVQQPTGLSNISIRFVSSANISEKMIVQ